MFSHTHTYPPPHKHLLLFGFQWKFLYTRCWLVCGFHVFFFCTYIIFICCFYKYTYINLHNTHNYTNTHTQQYTHAHRHIIKYMIYITKLIKKSDPIMYMYIVYLFYIFFSIVFFLLILFLQNDFIKMILLNVIHFGWCSV